MERFSTTLAGGAADGEPETIVKGAYGHLVYIPVGAMGVPIAGTLPTAPPAAAGRQ